MKPENMTIEQAIRLLHPETCEAALGEVEAYDGMDFYESQIATIDKASLMACAALEKQIPKKPNNKCIDDVGYLYYQVECGNCGRYTSSNSEILYCPECGQAIEWE